MIVQTSLVCLREEGHRATISSHSTCTCSQEILTEVEENGEGIQEIIDVLVQDCPSGLWKNGKCSIGEGYGQIQTTNYPDFYPASSNEVNQGITSIKLSPYILIGVEPRGQRRKADQAHL